MKNVDNIELEKNMSYILRHAAPELGVDMSVDGWVDIGILWECLIGQLKMEGVTPWHIYNIVNTSKKKRFEYCPLTLSVRATQGHSIAGIELDYKLNTEYSVGYHGTSKKTYEIIKLEGLCQMNRNYIHLSPSIDTAYEVGKRYSRDEKPVILVVDLKELVRTTSIYISSNNVILVKDRIDPKFIKIMNGEKK